MRHQCGQVPAEGRRSRRAAVLTGLTRATVRPLTTLLPSNEPGVRLARRLVAGTLAVLSPPLPGAEPTAVELQAACGTRIRGEWVRGGSGSSGDTAILYVHGSGYAVCSARTHRGLTSRLHAATGLPVFACDYRLAPRYRFPAAADDVRACYDWLRELGYRVVVAGDSAGGHLAVDLACELARSGGPTPAALVLFSPLLDPTLGLAAERERSGRDPMISASRARRLLELYTAAADTSDPRLRLSIPAGTAWPPTIVQAGGAEMLAADAEGLAERITAAGGECRLQVWPGQVHVFQAFAAVLPEARDALAEAAGFVVETVREEPV